MKRIGIRLSLPEDMGALADIRSRCMSETQEDGEPPVDSAAIFSRFVGYSAWPNVMIALAYEPVGQLEVVLGFVCLRVGRSRILIDNIAVDKPYRRQGVGRSLLCYAHQTCNRRRHKSLALVEPDDCEMMRFLGECGYWAMGYRIAKGRSLARLEYEHDDIMLARQSDYLRRRGVQIAKHTHPR
jgi:GNAT superfamily N-acetyltransferase